jgi:hypothetical protein
MLHNLFEVVRVDGMKDVKEVIPARSFLIWIGVLKIYVEVRILFEFSPKVLH